ncbi:MAG: hypothetical protein QNK04_10905 [Myxococcota bacterium]|nr:hypothetical protein [Myxococcota bacterium]
MPADEIAEGAARFIGRVLWEVFVHLVLEIVCYGVGLVFLRAISFNQYPASPFSERDSQICQFVGLAVLVALFALLVAFKQSV